MGSSEGLGACVGEFLGLFNLCNEGFDGSGGVPSLAHFGFVVEKFLGADLGISGE